MKIQINFLKNKILVFTGLVLLSLSGFSLDLPTRPEPPTLVNDFAGIIDQGSKMQLERKLVDFFASTSNQIAVVTVNDLQGYDPADFAFRLGEKWGIGNAKFDNGILILVKPKTSDSRGEAFIAVGYGLEGAIPDAIAKRIVEQEMIPGFKQGDMAGGINNAVEVLSSLARGEYSSQQYAKKRSGGAGIGSLFFVFLVFIVVISRFSRSGRYYSSGSRSSLPFWLAMGLFSGAGRRHDGFFDSFSNGSGSFGGGSGSSFGDFGGFGGGSFGGGGAGGSW